MSDPKQSENKGAWTPGPEDERMLGILFAMAVAKRQRAEALRELRRTGAITRAELVDEQADALDWAVAAIQAASSPLLVEALEKIARGPVIPPPDPVAHSWHAYARYWHEESDRVRVLARAALAAARGETTDKGG